jgi:hypothetical protein
MAINYLNSIDLNRNELQDAQLIRSQVENQPNNAAAGTGVEGQLYFDTTIDVLKVWANGAWSEVGGGVETLTTTDGSYINLTPNAATSGAVTVTADLSAVNGTAAAGERYLTKTNKWAEVSTIPGTYSWNIIADQGFPLSTVSSGNSVDFSGGTNINTALTSGYTVTVNLDPSVTLTGQLTVNGTGQNSFAGQVTIPILPVAGTDAASKDYVDNAVVGGLIYQGGYNAATNTPNLEVPSPNLIKKGWTYTVTADGLFFTEQVRVGDVLIAEDDAPTALTDWTTVQNNVDLASLTQIGIGNVNAGTGISVAYTNGTATVTNNDRNSQNTTTGTITAGNLAGTVTHTFGVNTIVQTISSTGDTVFCDVTRTSTSVTATVSTAQATDITILVQKIG